LEEFSKIASEEAIASFPENPKVIFTTIGIYSNEYFKYWAAEQIQKKASLVVGQHGGHYATFRVKSEFLPHELAISDYYLTWGWNLKDENTVPGPSLILSGKRQQADWDVNGNLLVICRFLKRYCYTHTSAMLPGERFHSYKKLLIDLVEALYPEFHEILQFRLHPGDALNEEMEIPITPILKNIYPDLNIVSHRTTIDSLQQKSRLNILTYDGTTFLESIGQGRPCILISDSYLEPFSDIAQDFYDELSNAGIYHRTASSAISHIKNISSNVRDWWEDPSVLQIRKDYCQTFVRTSDNPIKEIETILRGISQKY